MQLGSFEEFDWICLCKNLFQCRNKYKIFFRCFKKCKILVYIIIHHYDYHLCFFVQATTTSVCLPCINVTVNGSCDQKILNTSLTKNVLKLNWKNGTNNNYGLMMTFTKVKCFTTPLPCYDFCLFLLELEKGKPALDYE